MTSNGSHRARVSDPLRRKLIEENLPEVHKSRWNARYAEIDALIRAEEGRSHPDQSQIDALEAMLNEHEKSRFRPEFTAAELLGLEIPETEPDPVSEFMKKSRGRLAGLPEIEV